MGRRMLVEKTMDTFQDRKCESIRTFWDLRKPRTISPGSASQSACSSRFGCSRPPRGKQVQDSGQLLVEAIGLAGSTCLLEVLRPEASRTWSCSGQQAPESPANKVRHEFKGCQARVVGGGVSVVAQACAARGAGCLQQAEWTKGIHAPHCPNNAAGLG